jgi:hypothetical protein
MRIVANKIFILVIAIGMIGISCERETSNDFLEPEAYNRTINEAPRRIHPIEYNFRTGLFIVEVDGHQYLTSEDGGIYHLESCPCKNK